MLNSLVLISTLTGMTAAQSSSVSSLFFPTYVFDQQPLVASVVTASSAMAQFIVQCPLDVDETQCGLGPGVSVTMQPGTYVLGLNDGAAFTLSHRCVINQQAAAICTATTLGSEANTLVVATTSLSSIKTDEFFMPVTITQGLELLTAATGGSISLATPTTDSDATGTGTGAGAAPHITGNAVLAGAVALVGGALAF